MAATMIGVVYNRTTRAVLRVIVPDNDSQLQSNSWAGSGEAMLTILNVNLPTDATQYNTFIAQAAALAP